MAIRDVRSPHNTTGSEPMRGWSPGAYSSPSNARTRSDHLGPHSGKGWTPLKLRSDNLAHDLERSAAGTGNRVIPPVKP
jgi:hypothetical protein